MTQLTWAAKAAIVEQRQADRLADAAADRLAGRTWTGTPTTVAVRTHGRTWKHARRSTGRPALAAQHAATRT
jgi:hypothetical protein